MKKIKILMIEDDQPTIKIFQEVFLMAGFEIEFIDTGKDALKRIEEIREGKKEKPDLILLDLLLPDINGIEILKEARKYPETKKIKIYILTNFSQPEINEELIREGADKVLMKFEYTLNKLIEIIKENITPAP